jgi:hypothetical protein
MRARRLPSALLRPPAARASGRPAAPRARGKAGPEASRWDRVVLEARSRASPPRDDRGEALTDRRRRPGTLTRCSWTSGAVAAGAQLFRLDPGPTDAALRGEGRPQLARGAQRALSEAERMARWSNGNAASQRARTAAHAAEVAPRAVTQAKRVARAGAISRARPRALRRASWAARSRALAGRPDSGAPGAGALEAILDVPRRRRSPCAWGLGELRAGPRRAALDGGRGFRRVDPAPAPTRCCDVADASGALKAGSYARAESWRAQAPQPVAPRRRDARRPQLRAAHRNGVARG